MCTLRQTLTIDLSDIDKYNKKGFKKKFNFAQIVRNVSQKLDENVNAWQKFNKSKLPYH